jgi:radical SAM protein with 4Fe4S-binding SPASM domain
VGKLTQKPLPGKILSSDSREVSRLFTAGVDPTQILAQALGPKFLTYREKWAQARDYLQVSNFPLQVDYELLRSCNLRCPMCPMHFKDNSLFFPKNPNYLTTESVLNLVAEGATHGQMAVGFGGLWEPLLWSDLPRIISFAREKGLVEALLNTNGTLLTPSKSQDLIDAGLTRLMVSLDAATPETYNLARPGGDFEIVVNNLKEFLNIRQKKKQLLPLLRLSFCLTSLNEKELIPFLERFQGLADYFSIQQYGYYGGPFKLFPQNPVGTPPGERCAQPFKRLMITHDGNVYPCCDLSRLPAPVGNIKNANLKTIWEGLLIQKTREGILKQGPLEDSCINCQSKHKPFQKTDTSKKIYNQKKLKPKKLKPL